MIVYLALVLIAISTLRLLVCIAVLSTEKPVSPDDQMEVFMDGVYAALVTLVTGVLINHYVVNL